MTALTRRLLAAPLLLLPLATLSCADAPHEPPQAVAETRELLCLEPIRCENGECDLGRSVRSEAECTDGLFARLNTMGLVTISEDRRATASQTAAAFMKRLGLFPRPAYAGPPPSDVFYGVRDGENMSGPGVVRRCEAKLHVCFVDGLYDAVLNNPNFVVNTIAECNFACDFTNSPSQQACNQDDCESRCIAARVPGELDDCT